MRTIPKTDYLPYALYRAEQVRELDRIANEEMAIPGATLMRRAGRALFEQVRALFPEARNWTVICGLGNNGGDGYVVARLAHQVGMRVELLQMGDPNRIKGDALHHLHMAIEAGLEIKPFAAPSKDTELIVDALLGTGLDRELSGQWREAVETMNRHLAPVVAADIPSGLHADTGAVMGVAVKAAATVTFIGLKQGLFTGEGPACCGRVLFDALDVPARVYGGTVLSARRLDWLKLREKLSPRRRSAHKGSFGHVLVVGGASGFSGAARLAGEGALRCGAGLVSVATYPMHATTLNNGRPELMCHGVDTVTDLMPLVEKANVIAVGPGLGRSDWGRALFDTVLESGKPLVVDADGLNLLAEKPQRLTHAVITPHPGEAARLLETGTKEIQQDRFEAVELLRSRYAPAAVLKGAGTLIAADGSQAVGLCSAGNPGMASGGMGDVLTGMIAAFIAQGFELSEAAELGVTLHAAAADLVAQEGERGMLASDLLGRIRELVNPGSPD